MQWYLRVLLLSSIFYFETVESIDVINVLIHPTISEEAVTTSITLTCAAYYLNDESFGQDVDVLWYFVKESQQNDTTPEPLLITANTRLSTGRLMFEIPRESKNATLHFIDASDEYNGQYYCIAVKDDLRAQSKSAVYKYGGNNSNIFIVEPRFEDSIQSSKQTLTCQTDSLLPEPPDIQWYYNPNNKTKYNIGNKEYAPYNLNFYNIHSEMHKSVLELVYASSEYNGEYYCIAIFGEDKQSSSKSALYRYSAGDDSGFYPFAVAIGVSVGGSVTYAPSSNDASVRNNFQDDGSNGNPIYFICQAESFSDTVMVETNYEWIYDSSFSGSGTSQTIQSDDKYDIIVASYQSKLQLRYSSPQYMGSYQCVVYGTLEDGQDTYSVSKKYSYLYTGVREPPVFVEEPRFAVDEITRLVTRSEVSLTCRVTQPDFYPPVEITWYRGSTNHKNARIVVPPTDQKFSSMYSLSTDKTVLTFLTYSSYNNGTYHCEVENSVDKVTSRDALYQYGDYMEITQESDSLVCNYSNANTAADTSYVLWYFERAPGHFTAVDENATTVHNDNNTSISSLQFHNISIADAGRYKCLFVKQSGEGKDKWAYGFYQLSMCSMSSGSVVVQYGDPISLSCSCKVPLSAGTQFLFYKNKINEMDKDIFEKYQESEDLYRLSFQANESGATLTIPYARENDEGFYECGYQLADESGRRFIEGGVNVTFQGSTITQFGSPFGFGYYNITVGLWQDIKADVNNNGFLVDITQDSIALSMQIPFPTYPRYINPYIKEYLMNGSNNDIDNHLQFMPSFFPTLNYVSDWDEHSFQTFTLLGKASNMFGGTASTPEVLPPVIPVPYIYQYTYYDTYTGEGPPPSYPTEGFFNFMFPDYNERVVAPRAQYTVLSVDYDATPAFDLGCTHCSTSESAYKTRCPYGTDPVWSFQNDDNFLNNSVTFEEKNLEMKLIIKQVEESMGGEYVCSFTYTDKTTTRAVTSTASQDMIVEGSAPLKPDHGVQLPIRNVTGEPTDVVVYADIWMRLSLYAQLVVVKWGIVTDGGQVEWLPHDNRQLNDWQTKRLKYRIDNLNDTTYICNVAYLDRTMSIQIPVVTIEKPPPVSAVNVTYNATHNLITFHWPPAGNTDNNYFRGYEVSLYRESRNVFSTEPAVLVPLPSRQLFRDTQLTVAPRDILPYCKYTLRVVSEYEVGRSVEMLESVDTQEDVPDAPSEVWVDVDSQDIKGDSNNEFLFRLRIDVPSVSKGAILGYKIQLFSNTSMVDEEEDVSRRRRRQAVLRKKKLWSLEILRSDAGVNSTAFTAEGGYNGFVTFNVTDGFTDVNRIRVFALTSTGYGNPLERTFLLFKGAFTKGGSGSNVWIYIVVVLVICFIICLAVAVFCYMKRHQQVKKIIKTQYNPLYPLMRSVVPDQWEINSDDLKLSVALGEGAFGRVMKGALQRDGKAHPVACKMLKEESHSDQEAEALWKEIALMKKVGSHPYIVNIIGCVTVKTPICLLVEYVHNGDLQSYLRSLRSKFEKEHSRNIRTISSNISKSATSRSKSKVNGTTSDKDSDPLLRASPAVQASPATSPPSDYINLKSPDAAYINLQGIDTEEKAEILTSNHMLNMMYQIACGMQYLSYKNIIHRDLAARNILVCDDMTVKVSDFGLARDMYLEGQYMMNPRGRVPFKWMSPEALFDLKFTSKSDVWSYGVLLWEIVTLGGSPYPGIEPAKLYKLLKKGYRMARPDGCSLEIYDIMKDCWQEDPDLRPPFDDLSQTIQKLMNLDTEDYLTVGQGIASIEESDEDENAVEIRTDEVPIQAAEQYSSVTSPPPNHSAASSSSSDHDNPSSPLLSNNRASQDDTLGPIPRADTLSFPTTTTLSSTRGRNKTGDSNYSNYSESCL